MTSRIFWVVAHVFSNTARREPEA